MKIITKIKVLSLAFVIIVSGALSLQTSPKVEALTIPGRVLGTSTSAYSYPSGSLVNDNGTIYFINGTAKIPFTSFSAFSGLGYSLKNVIKGNLSNYNSAKTYYISNSDQAHPWGSFLLYQGTVYYSHETGLIPVPSWKVFLSNGGKSNLIVNANSKDLEALKPSGSIAVLTVNDPRVYDQQISGTIQPALLPDNSNSIDTNPSPTITAKPKIDCLYPAPPVGYHYEGGDSDTACGKYLVIDGQKTIVTPTPTVTSSPASASAPTLSSVDPTSGDIGSEVTLTGRNFTDAENTVVFGTDMLDHLTSSGQGTQIKFNVPYAFIPKCSSSKMACSMAVTPVIPGTYSVSITNANGTSGPLNFTIPVNAINCSASGGCSPSPTPTVVPTSTGSCLFPISCAAPPAGYHYVGNGTCSCGTLVQDGGDLK